MSHSCTQWRGDIGAYIIGALDGCARDRVTRHLAACAGCRADYDELVPVRDWLSLLALTADGPEPGHAGRPGRPLHDAPREGLPPPPRSHDPPISRSRPGSGNQGPAQPAGKLRATRPRTRRWLPAAAAALAAAATAAAVLLSSGTPARTFHAADSATGVSGHAQLHDTPAGTQIDLTASGLPGHERCILVAVTHSGTDIAGSWGRGIQRLGPDNRHQRIPR